jgi:hypothetical protein
LFPSTQQERAAVDGIPVRSACRDRRDVWLATDRNVSLCATDRW